MREIVPHGHDPFVKMKKDYTLLNGTQFYREGGVHDAKEWLPWYNTLFEEGPTKN